mmetsp:Transcript_90767/g.211175  ORF Transcript_90767/g.211175 Transcript_90767/m.211175 type:complete len:268 (-) Transcript_90767:917-1720(-)
MLVEPLSSGRSGKAAGLRKTRAPRQSPCCLQLGLLGRYPPAGRQKWAFLPCARWIKHHSLASPPGGQPCKACWDHALSRRRCLPHLAEAQDLQKGIAGEYGPLLYVAAIAHWHFLESVLEFLHVPLLDPLRRELILDPPFLPLLRNAEACLLVGQAILVNNHQVLSGLESTQRIVLPPTEPPAAPLGRRVVPQVRRADTRSQVLAPQLVRPAVRQSIWEEHAGAGECRRLSGDSLPGVLINPWEGDDSKLRAVFHDFAFEREPRPRH